jgi:hypothetical protein
MLGVYELLIQQGFILFPTEEDNLIKADRAFFGARVINWIRHRGTDPNFNLQAYLVALTYYRLGMADLKFEEDELLYRYRGMSLGGVEGEFSEDNPEVVGEFHRPDQIQNGDGSITGSPYFSEPTKGDE